MKLIAIAMASAAFLSTSVSGARQGAQAAPLAASCSKYVGTSVQPRKFFQIAPTLPKVDPKGQFETTAAFAERLRIAASRVQGESIVSLSTDGPTKYDADKALLTFSSDSFGDGWGFGRRGAYSVGIDSEREYIAAKVDRPTRTYVSQSGAGRYVRITKFTREVQIIAVPFLEGALRPLATSRNYVDVIGALILQPQDARSFLAGMQIAAVIRPQYPYFYRKTYIGMTPSIDRPFEGLIDVSAIVADLSCILVSDRGGIVRAAFPPAPRYTMPTRR